jgi:leader peptidase (prepilin peptidase)/N-methyltransferase
MLTARNRCDTCDSPLPASRIALEGGLGLMAVSGLLVASNLWQLATFVTVTPFFVAIAAINVRTQIIPTRLVWAATAVAGGVIGIWSVSTRTPDPVVSALVAAAVSTIPLAVAWLLRPAAVGFGTVRLQVPIGVTIGALAPSVATAWLLGLSSLVLFVALIAALWVGARRTVASAVPALASWWCVCLVAMLLAR